MNIRYRWSRESDYDEIKKLLVLCFGDRTDTNAYEKIDGRYLMAILDNKIIAISGLCYQSDISEDAIEMSWTCTHPDYRHKGIMQELFKRLLSTTDETIYCFCWKDNDKENVNLHTLMNLYNFKLFKKDINCFSSKNCKNYDKKRCSAYKEKCHCCQYLYIRKGI